MLSDECLLHVVPVHRALDSRVLFALSNGATEGTLTYGVVWIMSRLRKVLTQL